MIDECRVQIPQGSPYTLLAQLDRAADFYSARPGFDSRRALFIKNGSFDRIAVLFFLCYDARKNEVEGLSILLDDKTNMIIIMCNPDYKWYMKSLIRRELNV